MTARASLGGSRGLPRGQPRASCGESAADEILNGAEAEVCGVTARRISEDCLGVCRNSIRRLARPCLPDHGILFGGLLFRFSDYMRAAART